MKQVEGRGCACQMTNALLGGQDVVFLTTDTLPSVGSVKK